MAELNTKEHEKWMRSAIMMATLLTIAGTNDGVPDAMKDTMLRTLNDIQEGA